jgi:hypothetical protein
MRNLLVALFLVGCAQTRAGVDSGVEPDSSGAIDDAGSMCVNEFEPCMVDEAHPRPHGNCCGNLTCREVCFGVPGESPVDAGASPDAGLACAETDQPCVLIDEAPGSNCCNWRHTCRGTCNY